MSNHLNAEERTQLAKAIMTVLDDWQVDSGDRITLLGLPESTKPRSLSRFRSGEPLPDDDSIMERCKHLLGIEHALHSAFPTNQALAKMWVTTGNTQLQDRTPLDVMVRDGLPGLERVLTHLQGGDDWGA